MSLADVCARQLGRCETVHATTLDGQTFKAVEAVKAVHAETEKGDRKVKRLKSIKAVKTVG